jgi:protein-disulfide isomerase
VALGALGAGAVIYANGQTKNTFMDEQQLHQQIEKYISNNSHQILEVIAKDDSFGATIKNFTMVSDEELGAKINDYLANNPALLDDYIRHNANAVAEILAGTDIFKNKSVASDDKESKETEEKAEEDSNKIYLDHWDEMKNNEISPSVGPKDAKVTVIEFFDFACGHCKALAPVMSQLMKDNPDVRFVFNPLFFISEHSPYAAKVSLAAAEKGKFAEVFDGIMTLPDMNEETINQILTAEGLNVDEVKKMIDEKAIRRGVQDIDALSQVLGINGVPMLLINGEAFYGRSVADIQNKINSYK